MQSAQLFQERVITFSKTLVDLRDRRPLVVSQVQLAAKWSERHETGSRSLRSAWSKTVPGSARAEAVRWANGSRTERTARSRPQAERPARSRPQSERTARSRPQSERAARSRPQSERATIARSNARSATKTTRRGRWLLRKHHGSCRKENRTSGEAHCDLFQVDFHEHSLPNKDFEDCD